MKDFLTLLRPVQWLKNLMLFFPPFLGGQWLSGVSFFQALLPFAAFCAASSSSYILNDLLDKENDRYHPDKRNRPIASGRVASLSAIVLGIGLLLSSFVMTGYLSGSFRLYLATYLLLSIAYSLKLKSIVLVDLFCISAGFLLRLQAGGAAFAVPISEWLFLSVFLLSVFLSTGKRLSEKQRLGESAKNHRKALLAYPQGFLEGALHMTGAVALVTYTMYVISRHSPILLYTVPLSCFGLLRYILRVQSGKSGDPTESLTQDIPLLLVGLLWVILVGWGIYG